MSDLIFEEVFDKANAVGLAAGLAAVPTPMVFGEAAGITGNEFKEGATLYHEPEGVCGFAWINVAPGTSRFARWLKAQGHARSDEYYGGVTIWMRGHGQSMERKEAHAKAMTEALKEALDDDGLRVHWNSRMD